MKSIAVIGNGFVGGSLSTVMSERGLVVYAYDKSNTYAHYAKPCVKRVLLETHQLFDDIVDVHEYAFPVSVSELVNACETKKDFSGVFFMCLPTPMFEDGSADLSIVESVLAELAAVPGKRIAVVKSTVPPGSTEHWNKQYADSDLTVVFNPEFLVERTALDDMRNQDRIILGGPKVAVNKVKQVYQAAFPTVPIIKTSSTNAEMVKYVANCFLATKVSFANEMYQIVDGLSKQGLDTDYDRIIECATLDKRLGTSHWKVPSMETDESGKPLMGFSLSCFPKDVNALMTLARSLDVDPKVLNGAWTKNVEVRPGRDWEKMAGRAVSKKKT